MSIDMYLPALPTIAKDTAATAGEISTTLSAFFVALAVGQLIVGPLSDRVGRRRPIIVGLIIFILGCGWAGTAQTVNPLIAARFVQGIGAAGVMVTGRAIVRDMFDHLETARFLSMLTLISGMSPALAPSLGSLILMATSWRTIFWFTGAMAMLLLSGTLVALPETRTIERRLEARMDHPLLSYWTLLRDRRLIGYLLAAACNMGCFFTYISSAPLVFMQGYHVSPNWFGLIIAFNAIGLVGAGQLNRWLLKSRQPDQVLKGSARNAVLLALIYLAVFFTHSGGLMLILPLIFIVIASNSVIQANTLAGALSIDPERSGATAALFGATAFAVGTLSSALSGVLFDGTPRGMMAMIAVGLLGTAAALYFLVVPDHNSAARRSGKD